MKKYCHECGWVPRRIRKLAERKLSYFREGFIQPRITRNKRHLVINVTPRYRLLSRDNGRHWNLMSHSRYNTEVDL